jgi:MoaA/NifB/PqqE/SkfB family radical SAM enzyme
MYPHITQMVAIAASRGLWVMLNTNAVLLSQKMSEELLEAGLTDIFFSFDSPYQEAYESVRLGAKYFKVIDNIKNFMEIKERLGKSAVQTRASMVLPEGEPDDLKVTQSDYIKLFRDLKVAEIGFGLPTVLDCNYADLPAPASFKCPDLFRRMFIFNDGICGPCCGDWERRLIVGDATKQSLYDIWHSPQYQRLRQYHLEGRYRQIEACAACSVPYLSAQNV